MPDFEYLTGSDIYDRVLADLIPSATDSLLIATATLKAARIVRRDGSAPPSPRLRRARVIEQQARALASRRL